MDAAELPALDGLDVEALKTLLVEQHAQYRVALNSNTQQIEHLKLTIEKSRRQLFGVKSERLPHNWNGWSLNSTSCR